MALTINRDFEAKTLNEKWVTEFNIFGNKLYLSTIQDLYNREIISYAIAPRSRLSMVTNLLNGAISALPYQNNKFIHLDIRVGITSTLPIFKC